VFGLGQGIMGMKSGKRSILQKMLYHHFVMMPFRHPFSAFIYAIIARKSKQFRATTVDIQIWLP
jgi:hypothetical protein